MTGAHLIMSYVVIVLNITKQFVKVKLIRNYILHHSDSLLKDTWYTHQNHFTSRYLKPWFISVSCRGLDTSAYVLWWKSTSLISKTLIRILCFPCESSSMNNDEILRCVSPSLIKCYEAVIMAYTRDALVKLRHCDSWQGCRSPSIHPPPEHPPWVA